MTTQNKYSLVAGTVLFFGIQLAIINHFNNVLAKYDRLPPVINQNVELPFITVNDKILVNGKLYDKTEFKTNVITLFKTKDQYLERVKMINPEIAEKIMPPESASVDPEHVDRDLAVLLEIFYQYRNKYKHVIHKTANALKRKQRDRKWMDDAANATTNYIDTHK
jgi:hypothetical protein